MHMYICMYTYIHIYIYIYIYTHIILGLFGVRAECTFILPTKIPQTKIH